MKIVISPRAEKELKKLPKFDQLAIAQKIRSLPGPRVTNEEKLAGYKDIFRVRVGDYRIVYKKTSATAYIILIRHRREVYRLLKELLD
ncbi:MAG: type II toxin-antitoxin system RelE family toxin [Patescibacteria group bacterium]